MFITSIPWPNNLTKLHWVHITNYYDKLWKPFKDELMDIFEEDVRNKCKDLQAFGAINDTPCYAFQATQYLPCQYISFIMI